MKIVISTQVRENYGAHDWDGQGECPQYWKSKGGSVFVVPNLTPAQVLKVKESGIPTLKSLIETCNSAYEEYVIDWAIEDDSEVVCEPWETPFELHFRDGCWVANCTVENGEYGYMNARVERKTEEYDMLPGGQQGNYRAVYTMRNGDVVNVKDIPEYFSKSA